MKIARELAPMQDMPDLTQDAKKYKRKLETQGFSSYEMPGMSSPDFYKQYKKKVNSIANKMERKDFPGMK